MMRLSQAIAIVVFSFGMCVALSTEAAPLMPLRGQNHSPVEPVGCTSVGPRCPLGRTWVCGPNRCACAPCGVYYGAPWRYPMRPWRWRY